jgi:hypothetical protein
MMARIWDGKRLAVDNDALTNLTHHFCYDVHCPNCEALLTIRLTSDYPDSYQLAIIRSEQNE